MKLSIPMPSGHKFARAFARGFARLSVLLIAAAAFASLGAPRAASAATTYLDPAQAFRGSARVLEGGAIGVQIEVAPAYHLYRERIGMEPTGDAAPGAVKLGTPDLPHGERVYDETFQKEVEVLRGTVAMRLPIEQANGDFAVKVDYQGCADRGLCYPPQTAVLSAKVVGGKVESVAWRAEDAFGGGGSTSGGTSGGTSGATSGATPAAVSPTSTTAAAAQASPSTSTPSQSARVESALKSGDLVSIAGVFLVAGLLLAFTPCVLPMVPILSSIIVGQGAPVSRLRGFTMALAYSLGMAIVYTAFGVVAGLLGEGLAAALQNPWVLGGFALLLATLSLSMFGVFELQMPSFVQSRLTEASSRLPGGRFVGVFVMGGLSALIVGPCVAAPLAGALVFISQTKNVVIGGVALFSLAMGMSVPLLLVGLSAGALLPRAGAWMQNVKRFFGVLLLAVALWLVAPVLPVAVTMAVLGAAFLIGAVFLRLFDRLPDDAPGRRRLGKGLALVLAVFGVIQMVGALSGANDPLQPLQPVAGVARDGARGGAGVAGDAGGAGSASRAVSFRRVKSIAELDATLAASARPVMLDFYADWCVSCKEMEHLTFSDPAVRARMAGAVLLQADVTANSPDDRSLLKRFGLFGPPGILFFDAQGRERADARVIGFVPPRGFAEALSAAGL